MSWERLGRPPLLRSRKAGLWRDVLHLRDTRTLSGGAARAAPLIISERRAVALFNRCLAAIVCGSAKRRQSESCHALTQLNDSLNLEPASLLCEIARSGAAACTWEETRARLGLDSDES